MRRSFTIVLFLLCIPPLQIATTVQAQDSSKNHLKIETGIDLTYDNNVWQLSERDRDLFETNRNNDPFFQKVEDLDDLIWGPYLYLNLQPVERLTSTRILLDLSGNFYTRNRSLNLGTYLVGLEQKLNEKIHARVTYTLIPREFLGIATERRGDLVGETLTTHITRVQIERELRNLDLGLSLHYKFRDFSDAFNEQDTDIYGAGLSVGVYSDYESFTRLEYQFERGLAAGRNKPGFNNDLSFFSHRFAIGPEIWIRQLLGIGFRYELKYKVFTTHLAGDFNHYAREDTTHALKLYATYRLSDVIELKVGLESTKRNTNQRAHFFDYQERSASTGLSLFF